MHAVSNHLVKCWNSESMEVKLYWKDEAVSATVGREGQTQHVSHERIQGLGDPWRRATLEIKQQALEQTYVHVQGEVDCLTIRIFRKVLEVENSKGGESRDYDPPSHDTTYDTLEQDAVPSEPAAAREPYYELPEADEAFVRYAVENAYNEPAEEKKE